MSDLRKKCPLHPEPWKVARGDLPGFTKDVADLTRFYVKRTAYENLVRNCERNDVRYARVPSGAETIGAAADDYREKSARKIMDVVATRDFRWLNAGERCKTSKQKGAKPWKKEKDLAELLNEHGFNVEFIKERNEGKTPDAILNGSIWEFKIPEAFNEKPSKTSSRKLSEKAPTRW